MEKRFLELQELRVVMDANGQKTLSGYAGVYDSLSQDMGGWKEKLSPGTFTKSLKQNPDIRMFSEHDPKQGILGRTKSGTLKIDEDGSGLHFSLAVPNTTLGNDVTESVNRGDIDGCSLGMVVKDCTWDKVDGQVLRTVNDAELDHITVTSSPAYKGTSITLRSVMFPDGIPEIPEFRSAEPKTRKVDGEDLTFGDFLIGKVDDTSTWKLPVKFSTDIKTKSHLQNALARFNQLKDVSGDEKDAAWTKLVKLAKAAGIDVQAERSLDKDNPDQDQPGTGGCLCGCNECWAGDCENCSNAGCSEVECRCQYSNQRSTDKLLAIIIEKRILWDF
jgi:hypothetical protein